MTYQRSIRRPRPLRAALHGFGALGAYNDESPCSSIPVGDPYRTPGNYCATADGGYTTFNADGSVYTVPGASASGGSWLDKLGAALSSAVAQPPVPGVATSPYPMVPQTGMSTTTKIALAGAIVLAAVLISR